MPITSVDHGIETGHLQTEGLTSDASQTQQLIDQLAHFPGSFLDPVQVTLGLGIKDSAALFHQNAGETRDMPQREPASRGPRCR